MNQSMLFVRAGEAHSSEQSFAQVKLAGDDTQGAYTLLEERISPQRGWQPTQRGSQACYLLQGKVVIEGKEIGRFLASEGDAIHLPQMVSCVYEAVGDEPCVLLTWQVPGDTSHRFLHIKAGEGRSLGVLNDVGTFKLTGGDSGGAYLLMEWRVPSQGGAPMHAQSGQETFYITSGSFTFRGRHASSELYTLAAGPGDVIHVPERVPHSYQNTGTGPGKMLVLTAPAGKSQQFFEEIGTPVSDVSSFAPAVSMPDPETLIATLQKYQVDFFL